MDHVLAQKRCLEPYAVCKKRGVRATPRFQTPFFCKATGSGRPTQAQGDLAGWPVPVPIFSQKQLRFLPTRHFPTCANLGFSGRLKWPLTAKIMEHTDDKANPALEQRAFSCSGVRQETGLRPGALRTI